MPRDRLRPAVFARTGSPNHESQRRQYGLQERARELGFSDVVLIDEDLGKSGSGLVERPGFQRLAADRLQLGLKGTMSEFELNLLRQRSHEAARQKARRGELRFLAPIGYLWPREGKLEMDPDQRIQQVLHLAFSK